MHSAQQAEGEVSGEGLTSTCFVHGQWKKGGYERGKGRYCLFCCCIHYELSRAHTLKVFYIS